MPTPTTLKLLESCELEYSFVRSLSWNILKSKSTNDVSVNPNANLEFLTTVILGLTGAIDWSPPVFAFISMTLTGSTFKSFNDFL